MIMWPSQCTKLNVDCVKLPPENIQDACSHIIQSGQENDLTILNLCVGVYFDDTVLTAVIIGFDTIYKYRCCIQLSWSQILLLGETIISHDAYTNRKENGL